MGGDRDLNIGQQEKWKKCVAGVESRVEKIITSNPDFCAGILSANGAGTFPAPKAGTMQRSGGGQRVRGGGKGSGGDSLRGNISDSGGSEWRESGAASVGGGSIRRQRSGEAAKVSSFFNWFMFSLTIGSIVGVTLIAWLNTEVGWDWAFVVCSIALLAAIVIVFSGKSFYRNNVPIGSPLLRLLQVPIFLLLSSISILFSNIFSNTTNYLVKINPNILLFLLYIQLGKFVSFISR